MRHAALTAEPYGLEQMHREMASRGRRFFKGEAAKIEFPSFAPPVILTAQNDPWMVNTNDAPILRQDDAAEHTDQAHIVSAFRGRSYPRHRADS